MPSTMRVERNRRKFTDESNRYDAKRDRLVRCARDLGERGTAAKVSVTDVTDQMGITRGLFYYYFGSKDELNCAIAESYVDDLQQSVEAALEGVDDDRGDAMRAIAGSVRAWMYNEQGEWTPMHHVLTEVHLHSYARQKASTMLAHLLIERGLVIDYGKAGPNQLLRRARFVASGLLAEAYLFVDETADELADAACAALRYRRHRKAREE